MEPYIRFWSSSMLNQVKGAAFVRTKLKNIVNGGVVEKTFRPTEKIPTGTYRQSRYAVSDTMTEICSIS